MFLKRITLQNFRQFAQHTEVFVFPKTEIRKPNRWGKTTIADAISWLLVGKLANGSADFESFKPKGNTKATVSAELELQLSSGQTVVLKKEFSENWVKPRGSEIEELKGHNTDAYINGIKKSATDYKAEINALFKVKSDEEWMLATNPYHFGKNLTPKRRLEIVTALAPFNFRTFLMSSRFKSIEQMMLNANGNDTAVQNTIKADLKGKNDDVLRLEAVIASLQSGEAVNEADLKDAQATIRAVEKRIIEIETQANPEDETAKKYRQDIAALHLELSNAQSEHNKKERERLFKVNDKIDQKTADIDFKQREITNKAHDIQATVHKIQELETANETLKTKALEVKSAYDQLNKQPFTAEERKCEYCGSVLESETEEAWNHRKAEALKELSEKYNNILIQRKGNKDTLVTLAFKKTDEEKRLEVLNQEYDELVKDRAALRLERDPKQSSLVALKESQIIDLEAKLEEHLATNQTKQDFTDEKRRLNEQRATAQAIVTKDAMHKANIFKAGEKQTELANLRKTVAELETKQVAIEVYRNGKLKANQEAIASVFPNLTFQFIGESLNGNEQEICDLMIQTDNGQQVKFQWANTANQIKTGIDFCKAYAKAINAETPFILIDNAEAITEDNRRFGNDVQVICFVAEREQTIQELEDELPFTTIPQQPKVVVNEIIVEAPDGQMSFFDGASQ